MELTSEHQVNERFLHDKGNLWLALRLQVTRRLDTWRATFHDRPTKEESVKRVQVSKSRWLSYAAAGAATAVCGVESVDAAIHYSGTINYVFDAPSQSLTSMDFPLAPGAALSFAFGRSSSGEGAAFFEIKGANASFRGIATHGFRYPSNLDLKQHISSGMFVPGAGVPSGFLAFHEGMPNSQWLEHATGYIGFRFDVGNGTQYGWARVTMAGAPNNRFKLLDYAYGDPGDVVQAGQRKLRANAAADFRSRQGSLGLLALGGAGVTAWRGRRFEAAP